MKQSIQNSKGLDKDVYKFKPIKESNFDNSVKLEEFKDAKNIIDKLKIIVYTIKN